MKPYFLSALHSSQPLSLRATPEGELCLLDWSQRQVVLSWPSGQSVLVAVAVHPEKSTGASLDSQQVKLWNLPEGTCAATLPATGGNRVALWGDLVLVAFPGVLRALGPDGSLRWEAAHEGFQNPALLALSGDRLGWSALGASDILLLDPATGRESARLTSVGEVFALAFHPDGLRLLASLTGSSHQLYHGVKIWSLRGETPQVERKFALPFQAVSVAVSPDGSWVVTGDAMGAQLWDYAQGHPERRYAVRETARVAGLGELERPRAAMVSQLRFDGEVLVTDGEELSVWQFASGDQVWSPEVTGADV